MVGDQTGPVFYGGLVNARQNLFVAEYLVSRNASAAAKAAGYSVGRAKQTGHRLLQHPAVASAIDKADRERRARLGLEADELVALAVDVIEKASGRRPITIEEVDGVVRSAFVFHPSAALRGVELLMKKLGVSGVERHEVAVSGGVVYTLTLDRELEGAADAAVE